VGPIYSSATSNANVGSLKVASKKGDAMLFKEVTMLEGEENV
jgi:hypothetical protein